MNSYILLRDNKESGPHSLADLEKIGLKSNDLIWVECQSVGWRNPGEINELKHLADGTAIKPVQKIEPLPVQESVEIKKETDRVSENHTSVFVKLPSGHSAEPIEPEPAKKTQQQEYFQYRPKEDTVSSFEKMENSSMINEKSKTGSSNPDVDTKYARSLDEIKEMYVRNLEKRRKRSRIPRIPKNLVRAAVYIALVGVGAVTVFLIMNPGQKMTAIADDRPHLPVRLEPRPDTFPPYSSLETENKGATSLEDEFGLKAERPTRKDEKSRSVTIKKQETEPLQSNDEGLDTERNTKGNETGHTVSIPKNEDPEIKNFPIASIADQVQVSTNTYTVAALGGIRDLELTLLNDSRFLLDRVTVELRYLNPSGVILKTQDVQFTSIHPKGTQTIAVKKSNRGVKVAYKIVRIESKGSAYTAGLQ